MRLTAVVSLFAVLMAAQVAPADDNKDGFDTLDDLKKDFVIPTGDPKSWSVKDGVIQCNGKPNGYLCTKKPYANYTLTLEIRYPGKPGNTGVLNYISGKHKIWPACVEVQGLYSRMAMIFAMGGAKGPKNGGNKQARKTALKPHQEWNKLEVTSKDGVLSAKINGVFIGKAGPYLVRKGQIGFQSEGLPVYFRNIRIKAE